MIRERWWCARKCDRERLGGSASVTKGGGRGGEQAEGWWSSSGAWLARDSEIDFGRTYIDLKPRQTETDGDESLSFFAMLRCDICTVDWVQTADPALVWQGSVEEKQNITLMGADGRQSHF
jgi:hypothetical protein